VFLRENPKSGYYNYLLVRSIEDENIKVDSDSQIMHNQFEMKLKDAQRRVDELDKEKFESERGRNR
jgi:hypothetical protein